MTGTRMNKTLCHQGDLVDLSGWHGKKQNKEAWKRYG